jgi:hypothetical protein
MLNERNSNVIGRAPATESGFIYYYAHFRDASKNKEFYDLFDHVFMHEGYEINDDHVPVKKIILDDEEISVSASVGTGHGRVYVGCYVSTKSKDATISTIKLEAVSVSNGNDFKRVMKFKTSDLKTLFYKAKARCEKAIEDAKAKFERHSLATPSVDQIWEQAREKANHKNQRGVFKVFINLSDDTLDCIKMLKRGSVIQQDDLFIVTTLNVKTAEDLRKLMLKNPKVLKAWNDA